MSREPNKAKRKRVGQTRSKELKGDTGKGKRTRAISKKTGLKTAQARKPGTSDGKKRKHHLTLSIVKAPPDQVVVNSEMKLQLSVACSQACDLRGRGLKIMAAEEMLRDNIELTGFDGTANLTDKLSVRAPTVPGEYAWTVILPSSEQDPLHEASLIPFTFPVTPHATSMAVWDIASPIEANTLFKIKAGAHCLAGCSLGGQAVEVYDQDGIKVTAGELSLRPYSDDVNLYWAELELKAPAGAGNYDWQVRFHEPRLEMPHEGTSRTFGFATVKPADCELTVQVVNSETGAPIKRAEVTLHPNLYHGITDEHGVAKIPLARGEYRLSVFASEKAPVGIEYTFRGNYSGRPFITNGVEYMLYVPDANKETLLPFQSMVQVERDTAVKVELTGVIEPRVKDTM